MALRRGNGPLSPEVADLTRTFRSLVGQVNHLSHEIDLTVEEVTDFNVRQRRHVQAMLAEDGRDDAR